MKQSYTIIKNNIIYIIKKLKRKYTLVQSCVKNSAVKRGGYFEDEFFISLYRLRHCSTETSAISARITCVTLDFLHFNKSPPLPQHKSNTFKASPWFFFCLILSIYSSGIN